MVLANERAAYLFVALGRLGKSWDVLVSDTGLVTVFSSGREMLHILIRPRAARDDGPQAGNWSAWSAKTVSAVSCCSWFYEPVFYGDLIGSLVSRECHRSPLHIAQILQPRLYPFSLYEDSAINNVRMLFINTASATVLSFITSLRQVSKLKISQTSHLSYYSIWSSIFRLLSTF
jgi:hypothetical protein